MGKGNGNKNIERRNIIRTQVHQQESYDGGKGRKEGRNEGREAGKKREGGKKEGRQAGRKEGHNNERTNEDERMNEE